MKVDGRNYQSIWYDWKDSEVRIIDQRWLPLDFRIATLRELDEFRTAISDMWVRGAPLIGVTAAYGIAAQMSRDSSDESLYEAHKVLMATRPTAINLKWALDLCRETLGPLAPGVRPEAALQLAHNLADHDVKTNYRIGVFGLDIISRIAREKPDDEPVRLLTHCNAGWLATVDWGTATSPMYQAAEEDIPIHVWVDETRPRNQGALTAWELGSHGISHEYVTDNAGGHLMQCGLVDLVIVGTDRTLLSGDVCNKIGTYLKALAANDNGVPFYVALPSSTIDWKIDAGKGGFAIEARSEREVTHVQGALSDGTICEVRVTPDGTPGLNPAFDVTPARLVSGLITERGICSASSEGIAGLFPERVQK